MSFITGLVGGLLNGVRGPVGKLGDFEFQVKTDNLVDSMFGKGTTDKLNKKTFGIAGKVLGKLLGESRVETFKNYNRRMRANYAKHDLIGQTSIMEYVGTDTERITLTILLVASLGTDIKKEMKKLRDMLTYHEAHYFIIGSELIGWDRWVVTELVERQKAHDIFGNVLWSEVDLTLESYKEVLKQ